MGIFVIALILVYHFLGEDLHQQKHEANAEEPVTNWFVDFCILYFEIFLHSLNTILPIDLDINQLWSYIN